MNDNDRRRSVLTTPIAETIVNDQSMVASPGDYITGSNHILPTGGAAR